MRISNSEDSDFFSDQVRIGILNLLIHTAHTRSRGSFEINKASLAPGGTPGVSDDEVRSGGTSASVVTVADSNNSVIEGCAAGSCVGNDT